ncbi:hypothetical protein [Streptomyces flaveus]
MQSLIAPLLRKPNSRRWAVDRTEYAGRWLWPLEIPGLAITRPA